MKDDKAFITGRMISTLAFLQLFALWHLGYIHCIAFQVETGIFHMMLWKVIPGLCFGIVLGAVRPRTKNDYITYCLNLFGRWRAYPG